MTSTTDVQDILTLSALIDAAADKTELIAGLLNWRSLGFASAVAVAVGTERTQANVEAARKPAEVAPQPAEYPAEMEEAEKEAEAVAPQPKKTPAKKVSPPVASKAKAKPEPTPDPSDSDDVDF